MMTEFDDVTERVRAGEKAAPRPTLDFMKPRFSRWVALGFGSGLAPFAPGTFGTLFGWATFVPLAALTGRSGMLVVVALGLLLGVWAVRRAGRDLGVVDHGAIVWDEIVAIWLVLCVVPGTFAAQLLAFLLFRFFDVVKPPPIRQVDRRLKTPWGVMLDDLLAAGYTMALFYLWEQIR
jgi:phosphatidylglycerophosphatase A